MGGKLHLRLNIGERPIANKYREGKMKRSLKRELIVLEIAKREANKPNHLISATPLSGEVWLRSCVVSALLYPCELGFLTSLLSVSQSIWFVRELVDHLLD